MKQEKSCGALVFLCDEGNWNVLMVKHKAGGHWAFPKGHVEKDETETETAMREVLEETGISIKIYPGYRETNTYSPYKGAIKEVVYFWAEALNSDTRPQPDEIAIARFVPIGDAAKMLTYEADRHLLSTALAKA